MKLPHPPIRIPSTVARMAAPAALLALLGLCFVWSLDAKVTAGRAERAAAAALDTDRLTAERSAVAMLSRWGATGAPIEARKGNAYWFITLAGSGTCYQVATPVYGTAKAAAAAPAIVPCPDSPTFAAGGKDLERDDPRREVATGFLEAWLGGKDTERWTTADFTPTKTPTAVKVTVTAVTEGGALGDRAEAHVSADVQWPDHTGEARWTVGLTQVNAKWFVSGLEAQPLAASEPQATLKPTPTTEGTRS